VKAGLDARWSILLCLVYVIVVVSTPLGAWRVLAAEALVLTFVLGLSGIDPARIAARWLGLLVIVAMLALLLGFTHPARASLGVAGVVVAILAKNALVLGAILTLSASHASHRLLGALRRLRVPPILVTTLHFMDRYANVLASERDRMMLARRSRSFSRRGRLGASALAGLLAALFVRSIERGEPVHSAMLARGWDGTMRALDGP
jgi:cobalt/nickel transport system permease protein